MPSWPTCGDAFGDSQSLRPLPQRPLVERSEPKLVAPRCQAPSEAFDSSPGVSDAQWERIQLPLYRRVPSVRAVSEPAFVLISLEVRDGPSCERSRRAAPLRRWGRAGRAGGKQTLGEPQRGGERVRHTTARLHSPPKRTETPTHFHRALVGSGRLENISPLAKTAAAARELGTPERQQ